MIVFVVGCLVPTLSTTKHKGLSNNVKRPTQMQLLHWQVVEAHAVLNPRGFENIVFKVVRSQVQEMLHVFIVFHVGVTHVQNHHFHSKLW